MEFLYELLSVLNTRMAVPAPYGAFHIGFVLLSVAAGVWLSRPGVRRDEAFMRRFLLAVSLLSIGLEVYKQINFSFPLSGGEIGFDYQWYAFPFQFCSTPMYISLLGALARSRGIHERMCAYLATYSLFAGICVMLYPVSVFTGTLGINIQTMVCHGAMVTMGIVLLRTGYVRISAKTLVRAVPVFMTLILGAIAMNELAYRSGLLETETFNMFFISPYCPPELPVYSLVQAALPGAVSIPVYIAGFTAAAGLVLICAGAVEKIAATARMLWTMEPLHPRAPMPY